MRSVSATAPNRSIERATPAWLLLVPCCPVAAVAPFLGALEAGKEGGGVGGADGLAFAGHNGVTYETLSGEISAGTKIYLRVGW